jgi:hypothetical protein
MLQIRKYQYNNLCDTYGCNNRAKHSLGREGYPKRAAHNLCDACLEDIAMQVPLEILLKREDIQSLLTAPGADQEPLPFDDEPEVPESEEALQEPYPEATEAPDDLDKKMISEYSWNELRAIAKELNIEGYQAMKRVELEPAVVAALQELDF